MVIKELLVAHLNLFADLRGGSDRCHERWCFPGAQSCCPSLQTMLSVN